MAMMIEQQQQQQQQEQEQEHEQEQQQRQAYKHYCRVCKKGFGCGRALGGHMRAHGINDDCSPNNNADLDDDPSGCSDWGGGGDRPPSNKRMYSLRTNPNHLKSCRVCENCGKEFVSWKSFLEHGKCSSDDEADDWYMSSPRSDGDDDAGIGHWSKGKRTRRTKSAVVASSEEEDLANCLMLLSSARVEPVMPVNGEPEESCASASKDEDRRQYPMASAPDYKCKAPVMQAYNPVPKGMFECKACKKVFASHQALGGHRASHKKVKGCFAAKLDDLDEAPPEEDMVTNVDDAHPEAAAAMAMAIVPFHNAPLAVIPLNKKSKVHECSICHRQFASGQALGGHKRCHWITSNSGDTSSMEKPPQMLDLTHNRPNNHHGLGGQHQQQHQVLTLMRPMFDASETLDLNLPASNEIGGGGARGEDIGSPLRLDVPAAALYLHATSSNNNNDENEGGCSVSNNNVGDNEYESKVKLAKLSELKDIHERGEVSPWLQVGIGSSGNETSDQP